jgi:hypothetical protein
MDFVSTLLSALLFTLFVPGVVFTLPKGGSKATVFVTHALLFALATHFIMKFYWNNIRGYVEAMGNFGATCPNGYTMTADEGCVPVGYATYNPKVGAAKSKVD